MAERYAKYAKAKQAASGASQFTPLGGSNTPGGTSSGTPPSSGTPTPGGGGGVGLLPGSIPINEALELYESTFGQEAKTLQDLVDTGVLTPEELEEMQSTAPDGKVWVVDPRTGLVTAVDP
jgi:hypothetical protein